MAEIQHGSGPLAVAVREFTLALGYIDLLAFTARGDVAIIECKLARNARAKREVIGQIPRRSGQRTSGVISIFAIGFTHLGITPHTDKRCP
ncbi:MAG TPA: hypothetical protein VIU39_05670 [Anaerolineales bacterium]